MNRSNFIFTALTLLIFLAVSCKPKVSPTPKPTDFKDLLITLERTPCFGRCPVYFVSVDENGKVEYEGKNFVGTMGKQTAEVSQEKVRELVAEFMRIKYFELNDEYTQPITDLPTTYTSITIDGRTKKVKNYAGAPAELVALEKKIDEVLNTEQWVKAPER